MESRHGSLTANNQVPYFVASLNAKDGPLVVEVPGRSTLQVASLVQFLTRLDPEIRGEWTDGKRTSIGVGLAQAELLRG